MPYCTKLRNVIKIRSSNLEISNSPHGWVSLSWTNTKGIKWDTSPYSWVSLLWTNTGDNDIGKLGIWEADNRQRMMEWDRFGVINCIRKIRILAFCLCSSGMTSFRDIQLNINIFSVKFVILYKLVLFRCFVCMLLCILDVL
jgi:hypothetical protein